MIEEKIDIEDKIFFQIETLIKNSKTRIATAVNSELVLLYWNIGKTINDDVLKNAKAEYGEAVMNNLAIKLTLKYGKGFSKQNLYRMSSFVDKYLDYQKVSTLSRKLSWFILLNYYNLKMKIKDYFIQLCHHMKLGQ